MLNNKITDHNDKHKGRVEVIDAFEKTWKDIFESRNKIVSKYFNNNNPSHNKDYSWALDLDKFLTIWV